MDSILNFLRFWLSVSHSFAVLSIQSIGIISSGCWHCWASWMMIFELGIFLNLDSCRLCGSLILDVIGSSLQIVWLDCRWHKIYHDSFLWLLLFELCRFEAFNILSMLLNFLRRSMVQTLFPTRNGIASASHNFLFSWRAMFFSLACWLFRKICCDVSVSSANPVNQIRILSEH